MNHDSSVPTHVVLSFALESGIELLITSPVGILWSSVLLPALAVWLLRDELGLSSDATPASDSFSSRAQPSAGGMVDVQVVFEDDADNAIAVRPDDVVLVETNLQRPQEGLSGLVFLCAGCVERSSDNPFDSDSSI